MSDRRQGHTKSKETAKQQQGRSDFAESRRFFISLLVAMLLVPKLLNNS